MTQAPVRLDADVPAPVVCTVLCQSCGRNLCRVDPDALRDGARLQVKCPRCRALSTFIGRADWHEPTPVL